MNTLALNLDIFMVSLSTSAQARQAIDDLAVTDRIESLCRQRSAPGFSAFVYPACELDADPFAFVCRHCKDKLIGSTALGSGVCRLCRSALAMLEGVR